MSEQNPNNLNNELAINTEDQMPSNSSNSNSELNNLENKETELSTKQIQKIKKD